MGKFGAGSWVFAVIVAVLAGGGCGGTSESTSQADCHAFIETGYCPKVVSCYMGQIDQAGCMSVAQMGLDCSKVTGENADPATCMTDLSAATCDTFVVGTSIVLPASCHGLFQLSP